MDRSRVVEIHTPGSGGRKLRFGSGYHLTDAVVLTAGHAVGAVGSTGKLRAIGATGWEQATVAWRDDAADAAVLRIGNTAPTAGSGTRTALGVLATDARMPCRFVGFPLAQKRASRTGAVRDTEDVMGEIAPLSTLKKGVLTIHIRGSVPRDDADPTSSLWAGMSGAAVLCGELLVGLVLVAPKHFGTDRLECVPVATLVKEPGFRQAVAGDATAEIPLASVEKALTDWVPQLVWPVRADHRRFGGRDKEIADLDAFVADDSPAICLVTAPSGLGKTALLVNWLDHRERREAGPHLAYTFLNASIETIATRVFTLRALAQQLQWLHGNTDPLPSDLTDLATRYTALVTRPLPRRGVVIIIDGIDEARDWQPDALLVPRPLPRGVHIVLSAREIANVDWREVLGLSDQALMELELTTLGQEQIEQLLERAGAPAWARSPEALEVITARSGGDPVYLRYLVDDILTDDPSRRITSVAALRKQPKSVTTYLNRWWRTVTSTAAPNHAVRDLIGYLLAARGLLTRDDLVSISDEDQLDPWSFETALDPLRRFVVGDEVEGYAISHARFSAYLLDGPLKTTVATYRDRLLAWCELWPGHPEESRYALRYYLSHLSDAVDRATGDEQRRRTLQLAAAIADLEFQDRHLETVNDLSALERDLTAATAHVARAEPPQPEAIVRSVRALEDFRRDRLAPEIVYDLAARGLADDAEQRLTLFTVEDNWAFVARLVIAWVAADAQPDKAKALLARLEADVPPWPPIPLVHRRVRRWVDGERGIEDGLSAAFGPLPQAPPEELASEIVARMGGGSSDVSGFEMVEQLGRPIYGAGDEARAYIAERDSPELVAFAAARPDVGAGLLSDYVAIHAANPYTEYRNRSLWAILSAAIAHPDPVAARDVARQLVTGALAPPAVAFREGLRVTVAALRAAAGEPGALDRFERLKQEAIDAAERLDEQRWLRDSWGNHRRRLAALAEAEALALGRHDRARALLDTARALPEGFAGFQTAASLSLAETALICREPGDDFVDAALTAAHNIQEPVLCAQRTARVNAILHSWWPPPLHDAVAVLERFAANPLAGEFAPLHRVGDQYLRRRLDEERLSLPGELLQATTLSQIADAVHVQCSALELLNGDGVDHVRIRDAGFAPILAARLAAEALANPAIPDARRPALIASLIPAAAGSSTPAHAILSRLLLAVRPTDPVELDALDILAPADWLVDGPAADSATEFGVA